jgi:membrane protease YdiL (CAAX protease family)
VIVTVNPRKAVVVYLLWLVALSSGFYAYLFLAAEPVWRRPYSAFFMWCPGLAALLTVAILKGRFRDLGLRWGRTRRYLPGVFLLPFGFAFVVYALVWAADLGAWEGSSLDVALVRYHLPGGLGGYALLALIIAVGVAMSCLMTLGEELGWRGLLVPQLVEVVGVTGASLVVGLIWSAWHYPLMLFVLPRFRPEPPLWYATLCFTLTVTGISFIFTWLRLRSASVWPAVVLHAAFNGAQELFEGMTRNTGPTPYLTSELGAGFTLVVLILLAVGWRRWTARGDLPALPAPAEAAAIASERLQRSSEES